MRGWGTALQDVGSFFGMLAFTVVASLVSRRLAFFVRAARWACVTTMFVFDSLQTRHRRLLDAADDGLLAAGRVRRLFDLFPRAVPDHGCAAPASGFCYNTVRYLAAPAPILLGYLATMMSFRHGGGVDVVVYLVGVVALIWAPETKGQPLPEG